MTSSPPAPPRSGRVRVLVVDDSAFARKVLREVLSRDPRIEVVGVARDGLDALEKIAELTPDVVTLDLVMANLDGVGVLRALSALALPRPPRVIVVSMTAADSDLAIAALEAGAFDLVHKPTALATDRLYELESDLVDLVMAAAFAEGPRRRGASGPLAPAPTPVPGSPFAALEALAHTPARLLVIGTSTGGPQALSYLLPRIPADFPLAIAIALHIPVGYTEALARRLDAASAIEVLEADEGVALRPGRAVLARAGAHLRVVSEARTPGMHAPALNGTLDYLALGHAHRPSVDVLFESAAESVGRDAIGLVLTGMGDDGLRGARALVAAGGVVFTESELSCVVHGMPRVVSEAGLSKGEAPLEGLFALLSRHLRI